MKKKKTFGSVLKEFFRKIMVALKRRPQLIPLLVFVFAFLVYTLNLSSISNTTAKIQGRGMGLCGFIANLFSILSIVCFGNAFKYRRKVNKPMMILMYILNAVVIYADVNYLKAINTALTREESPIVIDVNKTFYIVEAQYYLKEHIIILAIGVVLTLLLPVYSKWIRKVKTSIEIEENDKLSSIELTE